eukprot:5273328-Amphidinium_carterae.1
MMMMMMMMMMLMMMKKMKKKTSSWKIGKACDQQASNNNSKYMTMMEARQIHVNFQCFVFPRV